ncbi:MAG: hypothetical protein JWR63_4558 [Conexibacter sp.]|nr:hypothetical protein [Conexibacter sp.]
MSVAPPQRPRPRECDDERGGLRGLLGRFDPVPGRQATHPYRNGAVAIAVLMTAITLAMTIGYYRDVPFLGGSGPQLQAEFTTAVNLRVSDPVRVKGIKVGKVTKVEHTTDLGAALVTMELHRKLALKSDARARVAWRTLLGRNMYVDIDPGSPSAREMAGTTIPRSRTTAQVEFDQLFEPLSDDGRDGLVTSIDEFDRGFTDPAAPGRNIELLSPTMKVVDPALKAFRGQRAGDLVGLVSSTSRSMAALGRSQQTLGRLVDSADVAFGVTAARRADLGGFLQEIPGALLETRTATRRLRTTLDVLDPIAERLRPGVRELDDAATALRPALRQARPLLSDADLLSARLTPALRALKPASADASRLIQRLDPTLNRSTSTLIPFLKAPNELGLANVNTIGPTASVLASTAQQFNGFGHQIRFQGVAGGERSVGLPCATFFNDPAASTRLKCDDLSTVFSGLFGARPARTTRKAGR